MPVNKQPWPEGTPAWVDLMATDVDQAKAFYAALFGWEFDESGPEFGGYATARIGDNAVAGIGPAQGPEGPPQVWTTYLAVDDALATTARAEAAGATVLVPVMEVGPFGSMAVLADPTGAVFGLWQSGVHTGTDLHNEPGALAWAEVMAGDYEAGKAFYGNVFGYTFSELGGPEMHYSTTDLEGRPVGGIGAAAEVGAETPPHWRIYFQVDDMPATLAKVKELGGAVVMEPFDTEFGAMAAVRGVGGEVFLLNQPLADPAAAAGAD